MLVAQVNSRPSSGSAYSPRPYAAPPAYTPPPSYTPPKFETPTYEPIHQKTEQSLRAFEQERQQFNEALRWQHEDFKRRTEESVREIQRNAEQTRSAINNAAQSATRQFSDKLGAKGRPGTIYCLEHGEQIALSLHGGCPICYNEFSDETTIPYSRVEAINDRSDRTDTPTRALPTASAGSFSSQENTGRRGTSDSSKNKLPLGARTKTGTVLSEMSLSSTARETFDIDFSQDSNAPAEMRERIQEMQDAGLISSAPGSLSDDIDDLFADWPFMRAIFGTGKKLKKIRDGILEIGETWNDIKEGKTASRAEAMKEVANLFETGGTMLAIETPASLDSALDELMSPRIPEVAWNKDEKLLNRFSGQVDKALTTTSTEYKLLRKSQELKELFNQ